MLTIKYGMVGNIWAYILYDDDTAIDCSPHRYQMEQLKSYLENIGGYKNDNNYNKA